RLVANGGITITGHVTIEGRGPLDNDPDLARISVNPVRDPDLIGMPDALLPLRGNGRVFGSGDFGLFISPGDFRLNVTGVPANTYVKSIRIGGDDIQRTGFHVAAALPNPIQIVIGTDGATVTGSVISSVSTPMPNSVVALVPDAFDLRTRSDLY